MTRSSGYVAGVLDIRQVASDEFIVWSANTATVHVCSQFGLATLGECAVCRSFEGHVEHLQSGGHAHLDRDDTVELLTTLISTGLIRTVDESGVSLCGFAEVPDSRAERWSVSTVSAGRGDRINALYRSYSRAKEGAESPPLQVILEQDRASFQIDSRAGGENVSALRESDAGLHVVDANDRMALIDSLLDDDRLRGVDREVMQFALLGGPSASPAVGAGRNMEYLAGATAGVLNLDDDLLCRGISVEESESPFLDAGTAALELRFLSETDLDAELERSHSIDPLHVADTALQATTAKVVPADACSQAGASFDPQSESACDPALTSKLWRRCELSRQHIDLAVFGTVGDGGIGHRRFLLAGDATVCASDGTPWYDSTLVFESERLLRIARRPFVTSSPFLMSGGLAYRADHLLPPFFPYGMPEDVLFSTMLVTLFDNSLIAHVPLALVHRSPSEDTLDVRGFDDIRVSVCEIVRLLVLEFSAPASGSRVTALQAFGQWLRRNAALEPERFERWIRRILTFYRARELAHLNRNYPESSRESNLLYSAVEARKQALHTTIGENGLPPIIDFEPGPSNGDYGALESLRTALRRYGELLFHWPDIVAVARERSGLSMTLR